MSADLFWLSDEQFASLTNGLVLGGVISVALIALWLFLEKTSFGLIIRAGARDPQIVRVLGVNVARVWLVVFGIGTAIAGFAGLLAAPLQGVSPFFFPLRSSAS